MGWWVADLLHNNPARLVSWVVWVIGSICLHELGHGIALAYETLVTDEIAAGALLKVCEIRTPPREIYSIACPTDRMSRRKESAFRAWLLQNAPHQEMLTPGLVEPA